MHHPNKAGDQRGTSKREDIISNSIVLKHPQGYTRDDGARFLVDFTKCRVSNRYLNLISDRECRVIEITGREYRYEWSEPSKESSVTVLRFIKDGIPQKDIAEMLGLTKGRVSQIKSELFKKKMIRTNGSGAVKLTADGESFLFNHYPNLSECTMPIG